MMHVQLLQPPRKIVENKEKVARHEDRVDNQFEPKGSQSRRRLRFHGKAARPSQILRSWPVWRLRRTAESNKNHCTGGVSFYVPLRFWGRTWLTLQISIRKT